jgi:hypothetical protein
MSFAQGFESDVARGMAGDDENIRHQPRAQATDSVQEEILDLAWRFRAIGKAGIVGDIVHDYTGKQGSRHGEVGQAPDPRIEKQY